MVKHYIHAVHSVKGGSGKSSFSFALANNLLNDDINDKNKAIKDKSVLLMDADFKGTSLESIFPVSSDASNGSYIYIENKPKKYFNDLLEDSHFNLDEYICPCIVKKTSNDEINRDIYKNINIIFSSNSYSAKKKFLYSRNELSSNRIGVERFGYLFSNVLNNINSVADSDYKHIIFDLSPNSDEYTDSIIKNFKKISKSEDFEFLHYVVVTDDMSHIDASVEYILDLSSTDIRENKNATIIIVINQNYEDQRFAEVHKKERYEDVFQDIKEQIDVKLKEKGMSEELMKKIVYLYSCFNDYFFKIARNIDIKNCENMSFKIDNIKELRELVGEKDGRN